MSRRKPAQAPIQYKRMDDAELVARAQKELPYGMRAYEELVRRHEGTLYAVCLRLVGNRQDAEDVSQDVMLKVYTHIGKFEGRSSFKTWLLRIATNSCTDRLKQKAVADRYAQVLRDEPLAYSEQVHDDNRALELLKWMSPDDRQILTLRFVADLSLQEIADASDLSLSATKMRLYRATEKLRNIAEKDGLLNE